MNISDLKITTDILSLFNFTQNDDAKALLLTMISTPLHHQKDVIERQQILKGFLANIQILEEYSYSRIDYREAYTFLETYSDDAFLPRGLALKLAVSRKKHYIYRSKTVQLILLYHRLHTRYIKQIATTAFPESYKEDLRFIDSYFNSFRLEYYENLIRTNRFRIKHMVQVIKVISAKKQRLEITEFQRIFSLFEAHVSISLGIHKHKFCFPEITTGLLSLKDFYHPMLSRPVTNSFKTPSNVILLTGPNMSGKSTLLKAIGICVYLGNIGFGIPAAAAKMPLYHDISMFINLNDDLQSGYSHFMTEVINLKETVLKASKNERCLAAFDELFRGTNIDDALEISRTTLKGLLNFPESLFFVSSHLHQLTEMDEVKTGEIGTFYLDCDLQGITPTFTYRLKEGYSDIQIGRILFEKEGLTSLLRRKK